MTLSNLTLAQLSEACNLSNYNAKDSEETQGTNKSNIPCVWNYKDKECSTEYLAADNDKAKTNNKKKLSKEQLNCLIQKVKQYVKQKTAYWNKFKEIINGMGFKLRTEAMFEKSGIKSGDGLLYEDAYNSRQSFSDKNVKSLFEKAKQETDKHMGYRLEDIDF